MQTTNAPLILLALDTVSLVVRDEWDQDHYQRLQQKLRTYNRRTAFGMEPPDAKPLNIRVENEAGELVGGLAAVTYWGWLVIKLMVLDEELRGTGLGRRLLDAAHEEAQARGCTRVQTMTYDFQALRFYTKHGYRVVGQLEDYPEGYTYYWVRKDFEQGERTTNGSSSAAHSTNGKHREESW
jgi:GNAT superfamily N-acetyltransferase